MIGRRKNSISGDSLNKALEAACRGLVYVSETDRPVDPVFIRRRENDPTTEKVFLAEKSPVNAEGEQTARQFFDRLTAEKDWHTERDKMSVNKYRKLEKLIFDNLSDVRLIRRGRVRIDILLVGEDSEGNIAGIRTRAVET